jgi:1,4-alpha-glucan branching enzyme
VRRVLTQLDRHLFHEGTHSRAYRRLGAHAGRSAGRRGVRFAVWAPRVEAVHVVGDFNAWTTGANPLRKVSDQGLWQGFVPGARVGQTYKFRLERDGRTFDKADPYAQATELPPATGSVVANPSYRWSDDDWMRSRAERNNVAAPMSIYELHPGSWRRPGGRIPTWMELVEPLLRHVLELGFTHIELMPVMEHPFYGSWGYQVTSYFAPSARFGEPRGLMHLIDRFHQAGVGVILDWVPAHFPSDEFALAEFDGQPLYEHPDPRLGHHPDWDTCIFDYGRAEVRSFLLSSALFWLDHYHVDGLRFDAVASMLYLDYSRSEGEWVPNERGGNQNLQAVSLLQRINTEVYAAFPGVQTIAEESTAWPGVSRPVHLGGLGFGLKWDMGWMHDTLAYMREELVHRPYHHDRLTFRGVYAFAENFVLPLSHDEVVHGKGSLLGKQVGDQWQRMANLRLLLATLWLTPGKPLLFMGAELAQEREWAHERELDWHLLDEGLHRGVFDLVASLNELYRRLPALHAGDCVAEGFEWIDGSDEQSSVVSYLRKNPGGDCAPVLVVLHYTAEPRRAYRVGVPLAGAWTVLLQSDDERFGGSGLVHGDIVSTSPGAHHGHAQSVCIDLPPLAVIVMQAPA